MSNASRLVKRNQPNVIEFEKANASTEGEGQNFPLIFDAADDRCYIIVRNEGSKNVYCGFFDPKVGNIPEKFVVEGRTSVVVPIESGRINKYNNYVIFNISPINPSDILCEMDISVAAFQSGIIAH